MKCTLKPEIFEAFQWTGGPDQIEDPEWIGEAIEKGDVYFEKGQLLVFNNYEGLLVCHPGDYIINESCTSSVFPLSQSKFNEMYKVVE